MQWLKTERWVIVLSLKAPSAIRWRNLKTEVTLWKHIKCFPSTLRWRNLKTEVSLWKHIKCFPFTLRWRNLKTEVSLWKHIKCFLSNNIYESYWICVQWGKHSLGNHIIPVVTASISKSYVFKMFSVKMKTKSSQQFKLHWIEQHFRNGRHKAAFTNFSGAEWLLPKKQANPGEKPHRIFEDL